MDKELVEPRKFRRLMKKCLHDNLTVDPDRENPLLNGLVLENIFGYLKGQDNAPTNIAHYRVVCKTWDQEITKILRKYTQTNFAKIMVPYPAGLKWTTSIENPEELFCFDAPFPDVRPFESVLMNLDSCKTLENADCGNWFHILGTHVKTLCFSSPLICACQNQFLERILNRWCPNLERLDLMHVKCVDTLLVKSTFIENSNTSLICKGLKELKIDVNEVASYSPCQKQENLENDSNPSDDLSLLDPFINAFSNRLKNSLKDHQIEYMCHYGWKSGNTTAFPQIVNMAGELVVLPENLNVRGLFENTITTYSQVSETDGGIIGQLMNAVNLKKLLISGLDYELCRDLVISFHFRPNKWRSSLIYLGLDRLFSEYVPELHVLAQMKFPLTLLKLDGMHLTVDSAEMTRCLSYFADTLEYLEYNGESVRNAAIDTESQLELPVLPKLKIFAHLNITACRVTAKNLWSNAPNLEMCFLNGRLNSNWDANRFFRNTSATSSMTMRDLMMVVPISENQAEMMLDWFPNLVKIKFVLRSVGTSAYGFFGKLEKSKVKELKVGFMGLTNDNFKLSEKFQMKCFWKPENIKGLQILELDNGTDLQLHLAAESFLMGSLTSLKMINFRMDPNYEKQLLKSLSQIASVELINT